MSEVERFSSGFKRGMSSNTFKGFLVLVVGGKGKLQSFIGQTVIDFLAIY